MFNQGNNVFPNIAAAREYLTLINREHRLDRKIAELQAELERKIAELDVVKGCHQRMDKSYGIRFIHEGGGGGHLEVIGKECGICKKGGETP